MDLTPFPERPAYDVGHRAMAQERGPRGEDFAKQILATVASDLTVPIEQLNVLDVGSGYGHTALALAARCRKVTGIEPCQEPVRFAEQLRLESNVMNARFHHASLDDYSTVERFDLVILDNVLEHLPNQPEALDRIHLLLKPGGVLYLWDPLESTCRHASLSIL